MSFDLEGLRALIGEHGQVGRILIVDHKGSAPRETGTSMLVWKTGQSGTIGGGTLEYEAVTRLRAQLEHPGATLERIPLGPELGQCCGGAVTLVSEMFDQARLEALQHVEGHAVRCIADQPVPIWLHRLPDTLRNGSREPGLICQDGWLAEPMDTARKPLWVFGAGHVGRALVEVISPLPEFEITWIDTDLARYPEKTPDRVTCLPAPDPAKSVTLAPPDAHHLILTYSHRLDLELCHRLLDHGFASAGLIGSQTKWARFQSRLSALGHPAAEIERITCPIGDPGLGKHPQAIALSTASALLSALRINASDAQGERYTA